MQQMIQNIGLGLRSPHIESILKNDVDIAWFELLSDNWLDASGIDGFLLDAIIERYPLALHGVGMNIGGSGPINFDYLHKLKSLAKRCGSNYISDHLCFSTNNGIQLHDLLPLPYTEEALEHCIYRINSIQHYLECHIHIENISAYGEYAHNTITEAEFMNALAEQTGCGILLDINNLYVNQKNLQQDALAFIATINPTSVKELHLGGFTDKGSYYLDAHNNPVCDAVWQLYETALTYFTDCPTLIEWDNDLPSFDTLLNEYQKAQTIFTQQQHEKLCHA